MDRNSKRKLFIALFVTSFGLCQRAQAWKNFSFFPKDINVSGIIDQPTIKMLGITLFGTLVAAKGIVALFEELFPESASKSLSIRRTIASIACLGIGILAVKYADKFSGTVTNPTTTSPIAV